MQYVTSLANSTKSKCEGVKKNQLDAQLILSNVYFVNVYMFGYPDYGFSCFFLSCKADARVKPAKTGHGPHSSQLFNCVVLCIVCV
jgi:hypothetical protein